MNAYSTIRMTYILFYIPSFNHRINYMADSAYYHFNVGTIIGTYTPPFANNYLPSFRKCIFGLTWYRLPANGPNVSTKVEVIYPGTPTSFITELSLVTSIETIFNEIGLCLGTCSLGFYINPNATT
jgi:hypothetical protein